LRDSSTPPEEFRVLARKIITLLLYEATADLPVRHGTVQTPLKEAAAITVAPSSLPISTAARPAPPPAPCTSKTSPG